MSLNAVEDRPYLDDVRECVDLLIEHGTDRYGEIHSPTVRTMRELARVTGDGRYQDFVRRSLDYYLTHLVDDKGLLVSTVVIPGPSKELYQE